MREMDARGVPRAEAARGPGAGRSTVASYADMVDVSPVPPLPRSRPLVDSYAPRIDAVLATDLGAPRR